MPRGAQSHLRSRRCMPATNWGLRGRGIRDGSPVTTAFCRAFREPCRDGRRAAWQNWEASAEFHWGPRWRSRALRRVRIWATSRLRLRRFIWHYSMCVWDGGWGIRATKRTGQAWGRRWDWDICFRRCIGQSDQQKGYVYLSDGGHFENLAVYELIRRRCRLIVACDADCDPQYDFDNLLSLIEKARTDFGVHIEINCEPIRPVAGQRESGVNHVTGTIYYDVNNLHDTGTLIFIKASMPTKDGVPGRTPVERKLPDDVWHYWKAEPDISASEHGGPVVRRTAIRELSGAGGAHWAGCVAGDCQGDGGSADVIGDTKMRMSCSHTHPQLLSERVGGISYRKPAGQRASAGLN